MAGYGGSSRTGGWAVNPTVVVAVILPSRMLMSRTREYSPEPPLFGRIVERLLDFETPVLHDRESARKACALDRRHSLSVKSCLQIPHTSRAQRAA